GRAGADRARPQDRRRRPERLRREARPPLPRRTVRGRDVLRMGPPRRRGGTQMTTTAAKRPIEELKTLAEAGDRELAGDPAGGVPEANPADVIRWGSRNFDTAACAVACSMADAALPHYVAQYQPGVDVLFLDTGSHFRETYDTRNEGARRVDVHIVDVHPEQTVGEQD